MAARPRQHRPWVRSAFVSALLLVLPGCLDSSGEKAHLVVGTAWRGAGAQELHRELLTIAAQLGAVTIEMRTFTPEGLRDVMLRSQPRAPQNSVDVAVVPSEWLAELSQRDFVVELPSATVEPLQQQLVGQALMATTVGDRTFAFPLSADVPALVFDPSSFASPPRTLDDILDAPLPDSVLPFACDISRLDYLAPFVSSLQGTLVDGDGISRWNDAAIVTVLERMSSVWRRPDAWRAFRGDDLESLQVQLFAERRLASFVAGPWLLPALENTGRTFDIVPIPRLAGAPNPARAPVSYQCVVVNRQSQWADIGLAVGSALLQPEVNRRISRRSGRLPVLLGVFKAQREGSAGETFGFLRALEDGQPALPMYGEQLRRTSSQLAIVTNRPAPPRRDELRALFGLGAAP